MYRFALIKIKIYNRTTHTQQSEEEEKEEVKRSALLSEWSKSAAEVKWNKTHMEDWRMKQTYNSGELEVKKRHTMIWRYTTTIASKRHWIFLFFCPIVAHHIWIETIRVKNNPYQGRKVIRSDPYDHPVWYSYHFMAVMSDYHLIIKE